ncbi:NADPH:quinone reductase [Actinomadura rayongensis]|uniref:Zinc-binding dehydrogenase n=1 Tax=Actinomadura rayongensis TaxID=1429076 RepID=A0A6I4W552_9ACTN|nr:NADPH:quinone reductase [Actinomadura rayongensis]MXQ65839.1 zinc-binding dehydrogenase [Actinomadura rayongensis]
MRAVVYAENGPSSVLKLVEREPREPGPGEVRVRVVVSGVNPTDWKQRQGSPVDGEAVPNQDGAGVVDAVGPGVEDLLPGDRVWTMMSAHYGPLSGTAQEYTVLPAERVFPLPDGASFDLGASVGVPAVTAHRALTVAEDGPSRLAPGALAGRTVLVPGGAGAVGHAAIQLARWAGATVISTVSGDAKAELTRAAGAHEVVFYTRPDAADTIRRTAPDGVDIVVEVAASANAALNASVLRTGGTVAVYGNERGGGALTLDFGANLFLNARYQFLVLYTLDPAALRAGAEDVGAALRDGALPVGADAGLPLHRCPLAETAAAHDAVEGGAVGKVLIDVGAP